MAIDTRSTTTRRALISAGIGTALGAVVAALGRPAAADAADGDFVKLGYVSEAFGTTSISCDTPDGTAFVAGVGGAGIGLSGNSNSGAGVYGTSTSGLGVGGESSTSNGVQGVSGSGSGVLGSSTSGAGLRGISGSAAGVYGTSTTGPGVSGSSDPHNGVQGSSKAATGVAGTSQTGSGIRGKSTSGPGVHGESTDNNGVEGIAGAATGVYGESDGGAGVWGYTHASAVPAVIGQAGANGTGVLGLSGDGTPTAGPANTGVFGSANQSKSARGVFGSSTIGIGVLGEAMSGVGVYAISESDGFALKVVGRASFSRSGKASVPARANHVDVAADLALSSTSLILATLQTPRGNVAVTAVRLNYPVAGKFRIYLSGVASTTASTPVAWFILG